MRLYKVRGGTEQSLYAKEYNIGIGISLGNKWFTVENILGLVEWSLLHTKEYVVIYVADSIHAINVEVRKRKHADKARVIALEMGAQIIEEVKDAVEKRFLADQCTRIRYARWEELLTDQFQEKIAYLYKRYRTDESFYTAVVHIVQDATQYEIRNFTQEEITRLGEYIVEELPEILARTPISGLSFDAYAYPFDGKLAEFVERIQNGEIFPEIRDHVMTTEPKVFLEVRE